MEGSLYPAGSMDGQAQTCLPLKKEEKSAHAAVKELLVCFILDKTSPVSTEGGGRFGTWRGLSY